MIIISILITTSTVYALEKKQIGSVDTDKLIEDTQFSASSGADHLNFLWWVPYEFWHATFINDKTTSESDKKMILNTMRPYSLLMICQADISAFGAFKFYSKDEIESKLDITFKPKNGNLILSWDKCRVILKNPIRNLPLKLLMSYITKNMICFLLVILIRI